jgi:hypothetical protein
MKIVMPLFQFSLKDLDSFHFGSTGLSIKPFDHTDIQEIVLFSEQDLRHMRTEVEWSLIYESEKDENHQKSENPSHKIKANTLLMAFKIFSEKHYPFIKFVLSSNHTFCQRLTDTITFNYSHSRRLQPFNHKDLNQINDGFLSLLEMDKVSIRTHNALYFLYRSWHCGYWTDDFLMMMCALESIFSKDEPGSATSTITNRVSNFLNCSNDFKKRDIENLYDIRSRIMHGNMKIKKSPKENLASLHYLETVTISCFKKIVNEKVYEHFDSKERRDKFMETISQK